MIYFIEQNYFHELFYFDLKMYLIADVENAWILFHDGFTEMSDKHAEKVQPETMLQI